MGQQLVFKSKNALTDLTAIPDFVSYKSRVESDGGVIYDQQAVLDVLQFIFQNSIPEIDILSATSAAWGVKFDPVTKVITKLYNLFNPAGDIIIQNGTMNAIHTTEVDGKPSLYAGGSSTLYGYSSGKFAIANPIAHTIHHVPARSGYGASALLFPLQTLFNKEGFDASTDPAKVSTDYVAVDQRLTRNATTNNDPNTWNESHRFWGASVGVDGNLNGSRIGYASNSLPTGTFIYKDGAQSNSNSTAPNIKSTQQADQRLYLMSNFTAAGVRGNYYLGYIFENWLLNNGTDSIAKALSIRAKTKYR
ncbi:hypothetical protein Q5X70_08225 [Acinetobacter baumannii]|nr:hypothetical protein [Acinetobacter baumannii]